MFIAVIGMLGPRDEIIKIIEPKTMKIMGTVAELFSWKASLMSSIK